MIRAQEIRDNTKKKYRSFLVGYNNYFRFTLNMIRKPLEDLEQKSDII